MGTVAFVLCVNFRGNTQIMMLHDVIFGRMRVKWEASRALGSWSSQFLKTRGVDTGPAMNL